MLMIRSGLPSGPLSGHLSAPSAPAALDTPIFLAPRPIHRLLVHLHFEIVTSPVSYTHLTLPTILLV